MGNALSHKGLWDRCAAGQDALTVCEDNAIFNRHFSRRAAAVLCELPPDWDIILWGWNFNSVLHVELIEGMEQTVMHFNGAKFANGHREVQEKSYEVRPMRLIAAFGVVCYSLSPKGARSLSGRCFPLRNEVVSVPALRRRFVNFTIDSIMNKHYRDLKSYVSFPPLVCTENDKSTSERLPRRTSSPSLIFPATEIGHRRRIVRGYFNHKGYNQAGNPKCLPLFELRQFAQQNTYGFWVSCVLYVWKD